MATNDKTEKQEEPNWIELESEVHRLLEESARAKDEGKLEQALVKAKEAAMKEKAIRMSREQKDALD